MSTPDVDHIIAVHDESRPLARAVGSVLRGTQADVRVTVVCHNIAVAAFADALSPFAGDTRLRVLELADGVRSPSGPFNAGLDAATARFTSIMGSDDELEPGAIDSWLALAARSGAQAVLPRVRHADGTAVLTPPTRPGRTTGLDPVRDRLAYRSAPLGLISRERFGDLRMPAGFASGEDIEYSTQVWFSGAPLAFDRAGPAYLVHGDARTRVTTVPRPVAQDAGPILQVLAHPLMEDMTEQERMALVVKILRMNVLAWILHRREPRPLPEADVDALREVIAACRARAPRAQRVLSRTDMAILDAIEAGRIDDALDAVSRRTSPAPATLLPRRLVDALRREAPLRYALASLRLR